MPKFTIHDVSLEAGVSIATVSRVINKKDNVSREKVQRVIEAAQRMGYDMPQPPPSPSTRPRLIAVLVPRLSNPFYNDILDGIQDVSTRNKYNMIVAQSKSETGFNNSVPDFLKGDFVDGLISLEHADNLRKMLTMLRPGLPVVQCCEYDENLPYPYVAIDDYKAAYNVVTYLSSINHKRIAFINSTTRSLYGKKREQGFRDAIRDLELDADPDLIYRLNIIDLNVAFSACLKLLSSENPPDAIFAVSDIYAISAMRAAHKLGLSVPKDVAVVGFDNIEMSAMCEPPLTTVTQPRYEIGTTACATLFGMIKKRPPMASGLFLESDLVVRAST